MNRVKFMKKAKDRVQNELFPSYAWPGGYTIVYVDRSGQAVCPKCAFADAIGGNYFGPHTADIYWEGEDLYCNECSAVMESAYGPIEN